MAHSSPDPQVISFLAVRRALGLLGLALPLTLLAQSQFSGAGLAPSISDFYHTPMGDVLVGTLVAIGVFLIAYRGYPRQPGERLSDRVVSTLAGAGAIGVALFPVRPLTATCPAGPGPAQGLTFHWCAAPMLHFASAALLFLCLGIFCLCLFPRGDRRPDGRIDWRAGKNRLFLACGLALMASIAALLLYAVVDDATSLALRGRHFVFWMETLGVLAFAVSWLVKGRILEALAGVSFRR